MMKNESIFPEILLRKPFTKKAQSLLVSKSDDRNSLTEESLKNSVALEN
jgi:hypothetical protein